MRDVHCAMPLLIAAGLQALEQPRCVCWEYTKIGRHAAGRKLNVVYAPTADQALAVAVFLHSPICWSE